MSVIALTNLAVPHSYAFLAWDYASYFSVLVQVAWLLICVALVLACAWLAGRPPDDGGKISRRGALVIAALLVLGVCDSLRVFRTPYPSIAGDGEFGAMGHLIGVMVPGVSCLLPATADIYEAAAWTQVLCGMLYVLACAVAISFLRADAWARVGLLGIAVFMPQLVGAYGHYDGYAIVLLSQSVWWIGLAAFDSQHSRRSRILAGTAWALALAVACLAHPVHVILVAATLFYATARVVRSSRVSQRHPRLLVAGAVAGALGPLGLTALLCGLAALFCRFTLPFTQGVNDEFCCGILGTMAVAAAVTMFIGLVPRSQWRILLIFAVFAMYLQAPKILVYGTDRYLERCRTIFPHDRCPHNNRMSPYTHLGLILPADSRELQQFKLSIFAEGATTTIRHWDRFRTFNLLCYMMYSYEYGEHERGHKALELLVRDSPMTLRRILSEPANRFSAATVELVRHEACVELQRESNRTGNPVCAELLRQLSSPVR